jgi:predicted SAM-dependent methyltransferase
LAIDRNARPSLRQRAGTLARGYPTLRLRRLAQQGRLPVGILPSAVRRALDLDLDGATPGVRRVEIGGGPSPTPGYVHVDADRGARHLEHIAPAWKLPFDDGSVDEILAVHVLEHIHPGRVRETLVEWHRVLRPGGCALIHVPNATSIFETYLKGDTEQKWAAVSAIFGTPSDPAMLGGTAVTAQWWSGHQAMYDFDLLHEILGASGFDDVVDLTIEEPDHHSAAWQHLIPYMSLVVRARRTD